MSKETTTKTVQGAAGSSLFDQIYEGGKESQKKVRKDLVERQLKRKFQSAIDSTEATKDEAITAQHEERLKLDKADLNALAGFRNTITAADETAAALKEEYFDFFGEQYV